MNTKEIQIIFPHQLFQNTEVSDQCEKIYLIEEYLFFNQYEFHKAKLAFHRATMKAYENYLKDSGKHVVYIEAIQEESDTRFLIPKLIKEGIKKIHIIDPTDNWLVKHIKSVSSDITIEWYENPLFINSKSELSGFFKPTKKKFFQTSFYKDQRKRRNILMIGDQPLGGKLTYDADNRKKYPKNKIPPAIHFPELTDYHKEAKSYVENHFAKNYGEINDFMTYPTSFKSSEEWLNQFFTNRFHEFGIYEDAIVKEEHFLNHSLLSPLINV